jgi:hypothetical protein
MKRIFVMIVLLAFTRNAQAVAGTAVVSCSQNGSRIEISKADGSYVASYFTGQMNQGSSENLSLSNDADGNAVYATDMGFLLKVNGSAGSFQGLWPNPMAMVTLNSMVCKSGQ